jgi:hypothetical protein
MNAVYCKGAAIMTERDDEIVMLVTERFERRLAEENGKLRVAMSDGFGALRAEMIERNAELLKWGLVFGGTQTAALAALIALLR